MSDFTGLGLLPLSQFPTQTSAQAFVSMIVKMAFKCILIAPDLPDFLLPISSINGTLNANKLSTLNVVCPDGKTYATDISTRIVGGDIRLICCEWRLDGSYVEIVLPDFNIDRATSDKGARAWSISLSATKTLTNDLPKTFFATNEAMLNINENGGRRIRMDINANIKPGDVLILNSNDELLTRSITYTISASPATAYMTVSEE